MRRVGAAAFSGRRVAAAASVEDDARAGVGLEALLEVVVERLLGGGNDDEVARDRFRQQRLASQML